MSEQTVKIVGLIDGAIVFAAFQVIASSARLGFVHCVDTGLNVAGADER